jgi:hypothetical protein
MVNGPAWKALIEEEFGDGIMPATDFDLEMERVLNPKGERVKTAPRKSSTSSARRAGAGNTSAGRLADSRPC